MTTQQRSQLAALVKKLCHEQRIVDTATSSTVAEAESAGVASTKLKVRRYCAALEYVRKYDVAWNELLLDEQRVLTEFYGQIKRHTGACTRMQEELCLSERQVYRHVEKALCSFENSLTHHGLLQEESI